MKKIYMILALVMFSAMSWAEVSISITPSEIDFGTIEMSEEGEAEASTTAMLSWAGLIDYCSVFMDTIGKPEAGADYEFQAVSEDGSDYWYGAVGAWAGDPTDPTVYVSIYAIAPGDYSIKYRFYSYNTEDDWYNDENRAYGAELTVKAKVVAHGDKPTGLEDVQRDEVQCTKVIKNGKVEIIRNGERYNVTGARL